MAITLPIPCYLIETDFETEVSINKDVFSVGGDVGNESSIVVSPNPTRDKVSLKYNGLVAADARTVEEALKGTAGVTRISYNGKMYRLSEGYEATYMNGLTNISMILNQVA